MSYHIWDTKTKNSRNLGKYRVAIRSMLESFPICATHPSVKFSMYHTMSYAETYISVGGFALSNISTNYRGLSIPRIDLVVPARARLGPPTHHSNGGRHRPSLGKYKILKQSLLS